VKVTRRLRDQLGTVAREAADQARERLGLGEEEQAAPAADAPGNRPRAAFAGVLDGRHLWLAVDATPGTLAVREGQFTPGAATEHALSQFAAESREACDSFLTNLVRTHRGLETIYR